MIKSTIHGSVLEIEIANPPVNALGADVRKDIGDAFQKAQADSAIDAIVIHGGRLFSAGADITEFGKPFAEPGLPELVERIEASAKSVIAAINGLAFGGGLEVALACHYRLATPSAKLGLPEVKLGVLPGAGGTQRLPRLVGVEAALDMIVSGEPIPAEKAQAIGLVDRLIEAEPIVDAAVAFARTVTAVRRAGDLAVAADEEVFERFAERNARKIRGLDAPQACIEAVRAAATLPLAQGLEKESALFRTLVVGEQSQALRHAFFAERTAAKIDGLPKDTQLRAIRRVGVIGAGTMGGGISMNFLSVGVPVTIVEMAQEALDRGVATMRGNYEATAAKGRLTTEQVEKAMGLLTPTLDFGALADCDLVIEAAYENMDVKKEIFARLDTVAKPGAILASNTSFLSIDEMASVTTRPGDVVGLHFFSPANVMKLVEVVRGARTAPDVLATAMDLARKIGKVAVVAGVCHGFIGNRMLDPRQRESYKLLVEGATPAQIDKVHTDFGMPMGPFQMIDLAGCDIGWHRDPERVTTILEALCAQGRWGQKTKAGFYDYDERRKASPSAVTEEIIEDFRRKAGVTPREITDAEIRVRTLYTMINEGALILEGGFAQRASDIDIVWLYGYGWPRVTGGPMFWADRVGLQRIVDELEAYRGALGPEFAISTLLRQRAAEGARLDR